MTVQQLLAAPWTPVIEPEAEGGFRLTLPPLRDFEMFGETEDELRGDWLEALESHLTGYIKCGKVPPYPGRVTVVSMPSDGQAGHPDEANNDVGEVLTV